MRIHYPVMIRSWILSTQMTKTFGDICAINIVQQTSCDPLFTDVQTQSKI